MSWEGAGLGALSPSQLGDKKKVRISGNLEIPNFPNLPLNPHPALHTHTLVLNVFESQEGLVATQGYSKSEANLEPEPIVLVPF
jgi:hypothetical protein